VQKSKKLSFRKDLQREMKKTFGKFLLNNSAGELSAGTGGCGKFFSWDDTQQQHAPGDGESTSKQHTPSARDRRNFPVCNLEKYVQSKIVGKPRWLEEEFETLQQFDKQLTRLKDFFTVARKFPKKNRFSSVLANEDTRVKFHNDHIEYINANHIYGEKFGVTQNYVACQAPLPDCMEDFWAMVYEQKSRVIVMLAHEINDFKKNRCLSSTLLSSMVESECDPFGMCDQRRKVHQYWPNEREKHLYGDIIVENVCDTICKSDNLIIRECMMHKEGETPQKVCLYHFNGWPDMGVPKLAPFLRLMNRIDEKLSQCPDMGPIILHCVAGVGRTGTFAAIHIVLTQLRNFIRHHEDSMDCTDINSQSHSVPPFCFDIHQIVLDLKKARKGMVQEEDQYKFVYTTILEGSKRLGYHFNDSMPEFLGD